MAKFVVFGSGRMAHAIVYDLLKQRRTELVTIAARDQRAARALVQKLPKGKRNNVHVKKVSLDNRPTVLSIMHEHTVAISTIPYQYNYELAKAAIAARCHFLDLGGNNTVVKKQFTLASQAKKERVAILPDAGLAPGLTSVLVAQGLTHFKKIKDVTSVQIRVGGLPQNPHGPLNYKLVFSANGLLNEYIEPAVEIVRKKVVELPSLEQLERLHFKEVGWFEAFTTSGGTSTMPQTFKGLIGELNYKTIRYQGHADIMRTLIRLGLGSSKPTIIDGVPVKPRKLLEHLLTKNLTYPGEDMVLIRVVLQNPHKGIILECVDREQQGLTAMQRCTGFPAAITAGMLGDGTIRGRGVLKHELDVPPEKMIAELAKRDIVFTTKGAQHEQ